MKLLSPKSIVSFIYLYIYLSIYLFISLFILTASDTLPGEIGFRDFPKNFSDVIRMEVEIISITPFKTLFFLVPYNILTGSFVGLRQ